MASRTRKRTRKQELPSLKRMDTRGSVFITQTGRISNASKDDVDLTAFVDTAWPSQSTLIMQKARETAKSQKELEEKRAKYEERIKACQEKEAELAARRTHFQEQVERFQKFMGDNENKRERARAIINEELREQEAKDAEIRALITELNELMAMKKVLSHTLEHHTRYQRYLESVVAVSEDYRDINEILLRHDTLETTHADLLHAAATYNHEAEQVKGEIANFIKERQNDSLVLNAKVAECKQLLDSRKREVALLEQELLQREGTTKERTRLFGELTMAISSLYRNSQIRHLDDSAPALKKLEVIQQRVLDLQSIVGAAKALQRDKT